MPDELFRFHHRGSNDILTRQDTDSFAATQFLHRGVNAVPSDSIHSHAAVKYAGFNNAGGANLHAELRAQVGHDGHRSANNEGRRRKRMWQLQTAGFLHLLLQSGRQLAHR